MPERKVVITLMAPVTIAKITSLPTTRLQFPTTLSVISAQTVDTMSDDFTYSFVQNIPAISSLIKERLYNHLVDKGLNPADNNLLPDPVFLEVNAQGIGSDEPLCPACAEEIAEDLSQHSQSPASAFYHSTTDYACDTPPACTRCSRKLSARIDPSGAECVIRWSSKHVRQGGKLDDDDWYDLWMSVADLAQGDTLWDHVGYVLMEATDFYIKKDT